MFLKFGVLFQALRHVRQIAQETSGEVQYGGGRQPAVLRTFSQRLCRGFNDAVNGFVDDGWSPMGSDGAEDVTVMINLSPGKFGGSQYGNSFLPSFGSGVLCAKASMLLQNVPPAVLVRFLREHRSEWADYGVDAYAAASLRASPFAVPCARAGGFPSNQVILPLAQTVEHEESLEVVRLEGHAYSPEDMGLARDMYLLQLCSGVDENVVGGCAQLVFAPIDESFADDAPLLPSGFRIIPLEQKSTPVTCQKAI
jgi:homeobox-leucine zipper protein